MREVFDGISHLRLSTLWLNINFYRNRCFILWWNYLSKQNKKYLGFHIPRNLWPILRSFDRIFHLPNINLFFLKSEMRWKQYQSFAVLTIYCIFTHLNTAFALINFVDNPSQKNSDGNQLIYRGNNPPNHLLVEPRYYQGDGSKITLLPRQW